MPISCACVLSHFSHVQLFATLWTVAHQASLSMGFSRQEYWSGLPCPPLGGLPNPGIEPRSPTLQAALPSEPPGKPKNTGVNNLSLLQENFPTQESNPSLLHDRSCMSYQGSPCLSGSRCLFSSFSRSVVSNSL